MSRLKPLHRSKVPSSIERLQVNPSRRAPRFRFDGVIEVIDVKSHTRLVSLASNLSQYGCRVSTTTPFSRGANVELTMRHSGTKFKAVGTVIHSTPHVGMGISFHPEAPREWMKPSRETTDAALRQAASFVGAMLTAATAAVSLLVVLRLV
jgi:hypothetical protein